ARHRVLRRRGRAVADPAVVLLPDPRIHPGGRAPPVGRHQRRARPPRRVRADRPAAGGALDDRAGLRPADLPHVTMALDVLVLAGGISHERDISLRSGRQLADGLLANGAAVTIRDPDATLLQHIREHRPDVIWPALHGASGEDGALRGLLDFLGVPYVGATADGARLAWDKPTAKTLAGRAGVPTPASITLPRDAFRELGAVGILEEISDEFSGPLVVKPAQGGSSQGVTIVEDRAKLPRAMVDAYTYWDVVLIEQRITGTEISIG